MCICHQYVMLALLQLEKRSFIHWQAIYDSSTREVTQLFASAVY